MTSADQHYAASAETVGRIRGLHGLFEQVIKDLRGDLDRFEAAAPGEVLLRRADYWQHVIAYDSCVRLRQIIESNFHVIETLALLATTRYVFELSIWLKLGATRDDYAIAYYGRLLQKQLEHAERHVAQIGREVLLLEELEALDRQASEDAVSAVQPDGKSVTGEDVRELLQAGSTDVDRRAARTFSLYAERGKSDGYGYTAFLLHEQAIPIAEREASAARLAMDGFLKWCPEDAKTLVNRRWKWDREAKKAGVDGAYDFLYSYVSRLLHATPASVTTDKKQLEPGEIDVFLRYIYGALLDALDTVSALRAGPA